MTNSSKLDNPYRFSKEGSDACGLGAIHSQKIHSDHIQHLLNMIANYEQRGSETDRGADGVGLLFSYDKNFLQKIIQESSIAVDLDKKLGMGMVFLQEKSAEKIKKIQEKISQKFLELGAKIEGWRKVPVNNAGFSAYEKKFEPYLCQPIFSVLTGNGEEEQERVLQKIMIILNREMQDDQVHIASLSFYTVVYKGMIRASYFPIYFSYDLIHLCPATKSGIVHVRFSTNTMPDWSRAQPFQYLAHNGEINTVTATRNIGLQVEKFRKNQKNSKKIPYILSAGGSDSQDLNQALTALLDAGFSLPFSLRILVPSGGISTQDKYHKFFDKIQAQIGTLGAWEGPAALLSMRHDEIFALNDRFSLRPLKWRIFEDRTIVLGSELGAVGDFKKLLVTNTGQLSPGQSICITADGSFLGPRSTMKKIIAEFEDYSGDLSETNSNEHIKSTSADLEKIPEKISENFQNFSKKDLITVGWNKKDVEDLLLMLRDGHVPLEAMGKSHAIYALSRRPDLRRLYDVFVHHFAQVTNPPLDSLREGVNMDLTTFIGGKLSDISELSAQISHKTIRLDTPILNAKKFTEILSKNNVTRIFPYFTENESLADGLDRLSREISKKAVAGNILILDDRKGLDSKNFVIPPAKVAAKALKILEKIGLGHCVDLGICATDIAEPHDACVLLTMGISFVYPRGLYGLIDLLRDGKNIVVPKKSQKILLEQVGDNAKKTSVNWVNPGATQYISTELALNKIQKTFDMGVKKIMSKMGIATVNGYRGARRMTVLGSTCFEDLLDNPLGGFGDDMLEKIIKTQKKNGENFQDFPDQEDIEYDFNSAWKGVQGLLAENNLSDQERFKKFKKLSHISDDRQSQEKGRDFANAWVFPIDLLEVNTRKRHKIDRSEVTSARELLPDIMVAGAISHGAISEVAHESIALACNEMGVLSNSGEGGESEFRTKGTDTKIRQVASGRFGVNARYLVDARVIQIKMAQGAKPGEGGQLEGDKVNFTIATNRGCQEGVTLISPPPHHDIYSIEDLSQLIYDLKSINGDAKIEVKLCSGYGIGTIACGVAKAGADGIVIDSLYGGTGAAPKDSKHHAGSTWEIGLSEAHLALLNEGLRDGVELHIGGGLRSGLDFIKARILGADKIIQGTPLMIFQGCTKEDQCHGVDRHCTAAIAHEGALMHLKQRDPNKYDQELRIRADKIKRGLLMIAMEVEHYLADLGIENWEKLRDKTSLLHRKTIKNGEIYRADIDLNKLLQRPHGRIQTFFPSIVQRADIQQSLGNKLAMNLFICLEDIENCTVPAKKDIHQVVSTDRSIGAALSGQIVRHHVTKKLRDDTYVFHFEGTSGQSFGVFLEKGITFYLKGAANDYVAKGLSGGKIVLQPSLEKIGMKSHLMNIAGGKCLYGATAGELYIQGRVADRFAVRNSGALAVVEGGCGDFSCEYMTKGTIVFLGIVGYYFGFAMTGGKAFVYNNIDLNNRLGSAATDAIARILDTEEQVKLQKILEKFVKETNSDRAKNILENWNKEKEKFKVVVPR